MSHRSNTKLLQVMLLVAFVAINSLNCASRKNFQIRPVMIEEDDRKSIPRPKSKDIDFYQDALENIAGRELAEVTNLSGYWRTITDDPKQAMNLNVLDEVPNSTWFINRNAKTPLTLEEVKRGADRGTGPDLSAPLTVIRAKDEGVSPGFTIRDIRGDIYFVKFDINGYPQLNTAAEVIGTKFVYAAGYNTPENYLSILDPKKLTIAEGVTIPDRWGRRIPMTYEYLLEVLNKVQSNPDGTYRIVASKFLEGKPVGPFKFEGTRKDDPNDRIPHERRRELRGYKVISAWLNNMDAKANNSLDMYVSENGRGFVRHYLIDFATSLGSGGYGVAARDRGHRGLFDLGNMLKKILTLGIWVENWEKEPRMINPSVGYFESRLFNPGNYAQLVPNPAFQDATNLDGFWGAKIVMSFTDEQIRAIVETGEYENPDDADYIAKTLIERRDKTGRHWYGKINPLDNFRTVSDNNGSHNPYFIEFDDLAVNAGFEKASETQYRYKLQHRGKDVTKFFTRKSEAYVSLSLEQMQAVEEKLNRKPGPPDEAKILTYVIQTKRNNRGSWGKSVKVHFSYSLSNHTENQIVAIERED